MIKLSTLALSICSLLCIGTACKEEHTHSYTETVTAPTCTEQGFTTHTCSCGDSYVDTYVNALGHEFQNYVSNGNATCVENGTETATCSRDNCDEPHTRAKENTALGHDWKKDGNPVVNCTLSGGTQNYKCGRCTATKNEAVTTVLSGAPDTHNSLSVGDICQHCGKEVLAKNGNSLVMKIDDTNYQVEHYEGKAVGFYKYKDYIKSAYISDSVTEIGSGAFSDCDSLTSVVIGNGVTSIGKSAFYRCRSLTSVVIPDSVTSIGSYAFSDCSSLTSVYYKSTVSDWSNISIDSNNSYLTNATRYYYSENQPTTTGNYWHYDENGNIAVW